MSPPPPSTAASPPHHFVIIGNGVAGNQAAELLRDRAPESRITIITNSRLLFYNRYLLPGIFLGREDWRQLLAHPAAHYTHRRIVVRRDVWVTNVNPRNRSITLAHNETISYDTLLVAAGGHHHLPEELAEFRHLLMGFGSYEQAMAVRRALPEGGTVLMLGGDLIGLDLARTLVRAQYRVVLLAGETTFWPHRPPSSQYPELLAAIRRMGVEVITVGDREGIAAIEAGHPGLPARRIRFNDGSDLCGDVVLACMGLFPSLEFMSGSGVDVERGLLVSTALRTSDPCIYAAGDVCQIWSPQEHRYRFYYGYRNARAMGAVAAANMAGGAEEFASSRDEELRIDAQGWVDSPFWEYE